MYWQLSTTNKSFSDQDWKQRRGKLCYRLKVMAWRQKHVKTATDYHSAWQLQLTYISPAFPTCMQPPIKTVEEPVHHGNFYFMGDLFFSTTLQKVNLGKVP